MPRTKSHRLLMRWRHHTLSNVHMITGPSTEYDPAQPESCGHMWTLGIKPVSPHVIRYSTGVHLLQSGVDIVVIALWLWPREHRNDTRIVEADLATNEKALQKLAPVETVPPRFRAEDSLLAF